MAQKPLVVIADEDEESFYRVLPLWEERIEFHSLSRPFSFLRLPDSDLLLIDCGRKTQQGLELLARSKRERTDVPVIFISEAGDGEIALAAYRLGARHFFEKPVGLFRLKEAVEELLRIKRSSRERRQRVETGDEAVSPPEVDMLPNVPPNLLRAVQLMEKNLAGPLSVEMLADAAGMSRYHFSRVFKKAMGLSPMAFVSRLRMERAKELLRRGQPVSLICMEVGYNDLSNFIRQFKRSEKCTPGAYRAGMAARGSSRARSGTSIRM